MLLTDGKSHPFYYNLTKDIFKCFKHLKTINVFSLTLIIKWLFKNKKLKAYNKLKENNFISTLILVSKEYNIPLLSITNEIKKSTFYM
jgi:hypothetical protein